MTFERLESIASRVVRDTLAELPPTLRQEAEACLIELAEMEALMDIEPELDADLLGLFEGNSRDEESQGSAEEMPRIRLFLDNIWDAAEGHLATYREEVRITLLHELGHYLGLDEDSVAALGLA
jgi:predicted Zn-dependent protease with MMP-like domain